MGSLGVSSNHRIFNLDGSNLLVVSLSHTRTVVPDCCKDDDESQWKRGEIDPRPPKKTLNRWSPNFV